MTYSPFASRLAWLSVLLWLPAVAAQILSTPTGNLVQTRDGTHMDAWVKPGSPQRAGQAGPRAQKFNFATGPVVQLAAPDLTEVLAEDARAKVEGKGSRRISLKRELPETWSAQGAKGPGSAWQRLPDGSAVWVVTFESESALGVRLHFEGLVLPSGAELTVFNADDPTEAVGPYAAEQLGAREQFWSGTVFGPRVTVECVVPAGVSLETVRFRVRELLHRYVKVPGTSAGAKAAAACNLDVMCEPDWIETSHAVAGLGVVQEAGELFCTGCLVNDANPQPATDYFLTANHCVGSQQEADDLEFYWFYQTGECGGAVPALAGVPRSGGGADFLAGSDDDLRNDFTFLRLRSEPPAGVTYAGWSSEPVSVGAPVTGIHHPDGDFKRISFAEVTFVEDYYWRLVWGRGITEPGSSGSPLFNASKQLIGQLFGGTSACDNLEGPDTYGRFDLTFQWVKPWLLGQPVVVPNDAFASAQMISGIRGAVQATSAGATKEPGEPNHAGNGGGKSVWFRWIAPTNSVVTFTTAGSGFDTVLAIYTGDAVGALTQVKANDDGAEPLISAASFTAVEGTTYRIAVDGWDGAGGEVGLTWEPGNSGGATSNDDFADARVIEGARGDVSGDNSSATKESGEPDHADNPGGASLWFRWTAPSTGIFLFDTIGSDIDTVLGIYTGNSLGALAHVASSDDMSDDTLTSRAQFQAAAGQTYYIAVDGYSDFEFPVERGFIFLTWSRPTVTTGPVPPNDNFNSATTLNGNAGEVAGNNFRATKEAGEPQHAGTDGGKSVWYRWTAPANGIVSFDNAGSDFDSVMAVYSGNAVSALTLLGDNDDVDYTTRQSRVSVRAAAGTTYRIVVEGFRTETGTVREGEIRLAWQFEAGGGGNNDFAGAQTLVGGSGRVSGENRSANKEAGEPRHADNRGGASVWYRWVAPVSAPVTIETLGSTFDTALAVYRGVSVNALSLVAANEDISENQDIYTSRVTFSAESGVEYRIAVDGYRSDFADADPVETGSIVLTWNQAAPPSVALTNPQVSAAGFQVTVTGTPGIRVTLQVTTGLDGWTNLSSVTLDASGQTTLTDPAATGRATGFYRVRVE